MEYKIGIAGLGLIGASLAKTIKKNTDCTVLGLDIDAQTLDAALQDGSIDGELLDFSELDILIVALFPGATIEFVQEHIGQLRKGCIVIDICGVKRAIVSSIAQLCKSHQVEFIGGHPMAGRERWGYQNSSENLFAGSSMILTPIFTDSWALDRIQQLCESIGFGRVVFTDPESHDKMIGYTSQLAHILSSAYIKNPLCMNYKGYTGGSFQDLTRVARLNPVMWSELFLLNRQNLLDDLDILIDSLQEYRDALANQDEKRLIRLLEDGSRIKESLNEPQ